MDFALLWDQLADRADMAVAAGDLVMDSGLGTAVIISLGTDRLAAADDEIPDGTANRRGWWGDMPIDPGTALARPDAIGSRLWLLRRALATPATQRRAEAYAREALAWMLEDGVAGRIDVTSTLAGAAPGAPFDRLYLDIRIYQRGPAASPIYATAWTVTLAG